MTKEQTEKVNALIAEFCKTKEVAFFAYIPQGGNPDDPFVTPIMCSTVNKKDTLRLLETMSEAIKNKRRFKR